MARPDRFSDCFTHSASPTSYGLLIAHGSFVEYAIDSKHLSCSYRVCSQEQFPGLLVVHCTGSVNCLRHLSTLPRRNALHGSVIYLGNPISASNVATSKSNPQCPSLRKLLKCTTAEGRVVVRKQLHRRTMLEQHQPMLLSNIVSVLSLHSSPTMSAGWPAVDCSMVMAAIDMDHDHINPVPDVINIQLSPSLLIMSWADRFANLKQLAAPPGTTVARNIIACGDLVNYSEK